LKTALVMPFEPIGNKLRDEEKVLVLLTNLFVINIIIDSLVINLQLFTYHSKKEINHE